VSGADGVIRWSTALAVFGVAAVAVVGSYELLTTIIQSSQLSTVARPEGERAAAPLQEQAAEVSAEHLATDRVRSVRAIRAQLHIGQPRAQRLRDYLATVTAGPGRNLAAWARPTPRQLQPGNG
jgi:hypothetical protein